MKFLIAVFSAVALLALGAGCASNQTAATDDGRVRTGHTVSDADAQRSDAVAGWTVGSSAAESH